MPIPTLSDPLRRECNLYKSYISRFTCLHNVSFSIFSVSLKLSCEVFISLSSVLQFFHILYLHFSTQPTYLTETFHYAPQSLFT